MEDGIEERFLCSDIGCAFRQQARHAHTLALVSCPDAEGVRAAGGAQLLAIAVARKKAVYCLDATYFAEDGESGGIEAAVVGEVDEDVRGETLSTVGFGGAIGVFTRLVDRLHGK